MRRRKKTTTTVQVLTHIKEKLQFAQAETQVLKHELATLDEQLTVERDRLTKAKHARDKARADNERRRQEQGFVNSTLLVRDYETRKLEMVKLRKQLQQLKDTHAQLVAATGGGGGRGRRR